MEVRRVRASDVRGPAVRRPGDAVLLLQSEDMGRGAGMTDQPSVSDEDTAVIEDRVPGGTIRTYVDAGGSGVGLFSACPIIRCRILRRYSA